jgi:putative tricarboxylic transport membrane protein
MQLGDRLLAALVAAFSVAVLLAALQVHPVRGVIHGPSFFPTLLGAGMVGVSIILNVSAWTRPSSGRAFDAGDWSGNYRAVLAAIWSVAGALAAVLLLTKLGFQIVVGLYLFVLLTLLRVAPLKAAIVAAVVTFATFYAFRSGLGVPLPSSLELSW